MSGNTFIRNNRRPSPNDAAPLPRRRNLQLHRYEKFEINICLGSVIAKSHEIFKAKICNRNHGLERFLRPPVYCVGVLTPPQRHSVNALAASPVVPCRAVPAYSFVTTVNLRLTTHISFFYFSYSDHLPNLYFFSD